jgi:hypothetical protein
VLADRVGIIDHGHIVAEGTPAALKAEIGVPSVHAIPADEADRERLVTALAPYGERSAAARASVVVRLREGLAGLPAVVRAVDDAGLTLASLEIQAPSLDDVFLAKTGRSLEGAGEDEPDARRARSVSSFAAQVGARRAALGRPHEPAAGGGRLPAVFPMLLLLVNSGGLKASTDLPGFPTDSFVAFALAVPFIQGALFSTMNAGTDLARDIQTGFLNRLSLTSMRGVALIAACSAARCPRPRPGRLLHRRRPDRRRRLRAGALGIVVLFVFSA